MSVTYSILNITIKTEDSLSVFQGFEITRHDKKESEIICKFKNTSADNQCYGIQYVPKKDMEAIKSIFFSQKDKTHYLYSSKDDYSKLCLKHDGNCGEDVLLELFLVGFYSYVASKDTLFMHASAVEYQGKSIVFAAPSGIGKTTQAELWAKYKNATILNGDKVFLKREDDGIHAWGSPWKGSSPYGENASAPLRAIVALEQAEENSIRKLEGWKCWNM